jgi:hypothetical protein
MESEKDTFTISFSNDQSAIKNTDKLDSTVSNDPSSPIIQEKLDSTDA